MSRNYDCIFFCFCAVVLVLVVLMNTLQLLTFYVWRENILLEEAFSNDCTSFPFALLLSAISCSPYSPDNFLGLHVSLQMNPNSNWCSSTWTFLLFFFLHILLPTSTVPAYMRGWCWALMSNALNSSELISFTAAEVVDVFSPIGGNLFWRSFLPTRVVHNLSDSTQCQYARFYPRQWEKTDNSPRPICWLYRYMPFNHLSYQTTILQAFDQDSRLLYPFPVEKNAQFPILDYAFQIS